ncbi:hypothetical protein IKW73_03215 [Candidatus Saccharibacteria bacterium]|nr:hypothetical protein [Candidatus Saccharibacteria bacterium]
MLKKLILSIAILSLSLFSVTPVFAECRTVLGMPSWDCDVNLTPSNDEELTTGTIWQIVANIATDLSIIATYLALGYVIFGGYKYIFSSGDVGKLAVGKKTLNQAFIGLAIAMSASVILGTIRTVLAANNQLNCDPITGVGCLSTSEVTTTVAGTFQWAIGVAGVVALVFVVGGGIFYMTSNGDPNQLTKAKNMIKYALIGLVIVVLSEAIITFMVNTILNTN